MEAMYRTYGGDGLLIVGFNTTDDKKIVQDALKQNEVTFPNILDYTGEASKIQFEIYQKPGRAAVPLCYLIGGDGKIIHACYDFDEIYGKVEEKLKVNPAK